MGKILFLATFLLHFNTSLAQTICTNVIAQCDAVANLTYKMNQGVSTGSFAGFMNSQICSSGTPMIVADGICRIPNGCVASSDGVSAENFDPLKTLNQTDYLICGSLVYSKKTSTLSSCATLGGVARTVSIYCGSSATPTPTPSPSPTPDPCQGQTCRLEYTAGTLQSGYESCTHKTQCCTNPNLPTGCSFTAEVTNPFSLPNITPSPMRLSCVGGASPGVFIRTGGDSTDPRKAEFCKRKSCPAGADPILSDPEECQCNVSNPPSYNSEGYYFDLATRSCVCPTQYSVISLSQGTNNAKKACRPNLPIVTGNYSEMYATNDGYPVCGPGRIPVSETRVSRTDLTHSYPKYSEMAIYRNTPYPYAIPGTNGAPKYLNEDYKRCICTAKPTQLSPTVANGTVTTPTVSGGVTRFPSDLFEEISSKTTENNVIYGAVAISKTGAQKPREGAEFLAGNSVCGCPNFNEKMMVLDPNDSNPQGSLCVPEVSGPGLILTPFNSQVHDSQVLNRAAEPKNSQNALITRIPLLNQTGAFTNYDRKIWTCAAPYTLNTSTKKCEMNMAQHGCNEGNGSSIAPSSVSERILSATDAKNRFLMTVNKKLACCSNQFGRYDSNVKFDCVENEKTYSDFNTLWSGSDQQTDGGQPYAVALRNAFGKPMTGFFTLKGTHCSEFSEFVSDIQPGRITSSRKDANLTESNASFEPIGSTISRGSGMNNLSGKFSAIGLRTPITSAERLRCPILVRAAITAKCPPAAVFPNPTATFEEKDNQGNLINRRCSAAESVKVHLRVEQVFEIQGMPKLKTVDTIANPEKAGTISIDRIIGGKYGNACPPGTQLVDGKCTY